MRTTKLLLPTLKEDPADADVVSHKLLLRAGMLRQVARGIYDFLPLGLRAVHKVARIVREELDLAGCQEVLLPLVSPAELWQESERWDKYGKELLRIKDRHDREFCLGPTHEEVMTDLVRRDVRSYRDLPLNLYQIATKFRDEIRPRFGLMRGREFIMKDGYSFHVDYEDCRREYENMRAVYTRIFRRCGLTFRVVEADTGAIGGSMSHEFQVLAESGEDLILSCSKCEYAANVEKALGKSTGAEPRYGHSTLEKVETPDLRTIDEVSAFMSEPPERFVKTLIYFADGKALAVLCRGDDQISEIKLRALIKCSELRLADGEEIEQLTGAPQGFAGPVAIELRLVADQTLRGCEGMVSGANKKDAHYRGVDHEAHFPDAQFGDVRVAKAGDACLRCSPNAAEPGLLEAHRGIEVGQVFYLGQKYSQPLGATFLDADGNERIMEMGTYGIGITRTVAAAIEQNHDERGIVWPVAIAPYEVVIVATKWDDDAVREASEAIYEELRAAGIDCVLDDRDERAGVKFNDADLVGYPFRITVGPRGLKDGKVECKARTATDADEIAIAEAAGHVASLVRQARG